MTLRTTLTSSALAVLLMTPGLALASSHREAPNISEDPASDNTDVYAWVDDSGTPKLVIVANYNPLQKPDGGPNFHRFGEDVQYAIHINRPALGFDDVLTYTVQFRSTPLDREAPGANPGIGTPGNNDGKEFFTQLTSKNYQLATVRRSVNGGPATTLLSDVNVAPPNIGGRTDNVLYNGVFGNSYTSNPAAFRASFVQQIGGNNAHRFWAGPREDGFFVDLGAAFDLAVLPVGGPTSVPGPSPRGAGIDGVAGYNVSSIVLEVPLTDIVPGGVTIPSAADDTIVGVWASASRQETTIRTANGRRQAFGPWRQVSRLGLPLINELVIGLQDKDFFNATHPSADLGNIAGYVLDPVIVDDAIAVQIYADNGVDPANVGFGQPAGDARTGRLDIVTVANLTVCGQSLGVPQFGDFLHVQLGADATYCGGLGRNFPNGRQLANDVVDILGNLVLFRGILAGPFSDGVGANDFPFLADIPYQAEPRSGFADPLSNPGP